MIVGAAVIVVVVVVAVHVVAVHVLLEGWTVRSGQLHVCLDWRCHLRE